MDFKGKKFIVGDTDVLVCVSTVDSMYLDDICIVRCFIATNYLFGVHFYLKMSADDSVDLYLCDSIFQYSFKAKLDTKKENYEKILKMRLLSYDDNTDPTFEYSVDLLSQVLPQVVNEYLPRFRESYKNFNNKKMVVL